MTAAGVTFLDHTADVGFELRAASGRALLHDAGRAMLALLRGEEEEGGARRAGVDASGRFDPAAPDFAAGAGQDPGGAGVERDLALSAPDPARLLADWLRELLFLHEVEKLDYDSADLDELQLEPGDADGPCRLTGRVRLRPGGHAVREIKGVTYHEIAARPTDGGWAARVIFDV